MVMFILVGSTVFILTFQGVDGNLWVESMLSNLPGGIVETPSGMILDGSKDQISGPLATSAALSRWATWSARPAG